MFYAVFKNEEEDNFELWSDGLNSANAALAQGEMRVLDTYGSKSRKYMKRINGLQAVNQDEAKYLKLLN